MAPIEAVISGVGGAFPQSEGFQGFMNNLMEGKNLSSVDSLRWKPGLLGTSPHAGKIANVHHFDYTMFRVHKGLAQLMDPLARLMLERSMEAVLDAGLSPKDLENTHTSVFMTTTVSESESKTTSTLTAKKHMGYAIMAGSKTMMSNRISYFLKLNGPSVTLDGDWTVSLIALQRAVLSIESGESDYALVGAANTCLFPELNKIYENIGVISSDGQCRSLDARGSGCFRSEGAVVFLLQRSDMANRVYGRVKGVNELCRGSRYAFVGVDALALSPLIEDLYHSKGVDADNVKLLTSDGISIPEIERDEIKASAAALCKNKSELPVSTAKAVAGHGDAVGALISIIHAITAMETGVIPPLKHFEQPGAKSLIDSKLKVVKSPQPVELSEDSIVAVNTLGYTGCIGHSIFKPNTKVKQTPSQEEMAFPRLVILSGRTEQDAVKAVKNVIEKPLDPEFIRLIQQAFSNRIDGYPARAVTIVPSANPSEKPQIQSKLVDKKDRPVWFVYSGMGSQWAGMGKGLLQLPIFAETIQRLQPILEPEGIDLTHTITTENPELFEEITYSFVSIAAIQIGLTNVMKSLGIEPDGIIGHSTGELGCAYGDGCLTEEETLRAAYARGRASTAVKLVDGTMASIGMGWDEARDAAPASVDIACHNSADNCTVSGPTADVTEFVEELKGKNVFARAVNVSNIAFHSRYVQPAGQYLHEYLLEVIKDPKKRSARWVASSINPGDENKAELAVAGSDFFTNNLLSPVRFKEAMQSVPKDAVVIELAPHGLMQPLIRRGLPDGATCIALTKRGHRDGFRFLLEQVGNMYMECVPVKPWVLAPPVTLPVSRGTPPLGSLATWDHREELPIVVNTRNQVSRPVYVPLYPDTTPCITQFNKRFAAPSAFLEIVWRAVADGQPITNCPVIFSDLEFTNTVEMNTALNLELELQIQRETGFFEVVLVTDEESGNSICILKGMYSIPDSTEAIDLVSAHSTEENGIVLGSEEVYEELLDHDIKYDEELRTLRHVTLGEKETSGQCYWSGEWSRLIDSMFQLVALTDPHGSVSCGKIKKVTIAPQEIQALSNVLPVRYLLGPSILAAPGINIENYRRSESNRTAAFAVLNMGFGPLQHQTNKDTQKFIETVALHRIHNSGAHQSFSILVLEEEINPIALRLHKSILQEVGNQVAVRTELVQPGAKLSLDIKDAVIIVTNFRSQQVDRVLTQIQEASYPLSPMILRCGVRGGHEGFVPVASNTSEEGSLTLLTVRLRPITNEVNVIHIKSEEAVPTDLQIPVNGEVLIAWRGVPKEGIIGAVACVRGKPNGSKARLVIIMDDDAPEFCPQKAIYKERLDLGFMVNILQEGRWTDIRLSKFNIIPDVPARVDGVDAHFFGLNPVNLLDDSTPNLGAFDYSGHRDSTRVMGLARLTAHSVAAADKILQWDVPTGWTEEEAATVPMCYAVAYHVLSVLADAQSGQSVLIMNGTSAFSQACIRVALNKGCSVFVTVGSEQQRKDVVALNSQISLDHVIRHDKNTFSYFMKKATNGKGFDVVFMTCGILSDVALQSIALGGKAFVMSKNNALAHRIGLSTFIHSTSVYGAGGDALLSCTPRDKQAVRDAVQEGIKSGAVRPLHACVYDRAEDIDLAALRSPVKQLLRTNRARPSGAPSASPRGAGVALGVAFAIAGGRSDSLVTLARAASARGSAVVLAASREASSSVPPARAKLVPALRQTNFVPFPKAQGDAKQFLNLASKVENLKAIVMNVEDAADRSLMSLLQNVLPTVNGALRGVRLLVLTENLALGTETVESWRRLGLPACTVVGDCRKVAHVLPSLLTVADLPATVVVYAPGTDCRLSLGAPALRTLRTELPEAEAPVGSRAARRTFTEIPSLAPRLSTRHHRLEPLPLFTVTGPLLTPGVVHETASKLLSPVLVTEASQQTAESLAQEILRLQPRGPWAVVGDAADPSLLLRAATLVEKQAGRPDWLEVVNVAVLENGYKDTVLSPEDIACHAGSLHFIRRFEGQSPIGSILNKNKMRHFVSSSEHIARVLNESLLSPLCKLIAC